MGRRRLVDGPAGDLNAVEIHVVPHARWRNQHVGPDVDARGALGRELPRADHQRGELDVARLHARLDRRADLVLISVKVEKWRSGKVSSKYNALLRTYFSTFPLFNFFHFSMAVP